MKRSTVGPITTPKYIEWWGKRINDNIPGPSQGDSQPTRKHLQVVPSELEIIRQYFERRTLDLKIDYKKLRFSMRMARLGKTLEQWCQNIQEEKIKADRWERKFQEAQMRNETLKKV
ncbi:hypothetical protein Goari_021977 [Gossypium aridum]|uniref:Uncharacterized protein n=1 Tax=Gossypium aridum TaxID=34290 RepID=A0A7J8YN54_GOSAI|nr:hypothetical protein [Gossypium aridum]